MRAARYMAAVEKRALEKGRPNCSNSEETRCRNSGHRVNTGLYLKHRFIYPAVYTKRTRR